jgi:hypothetical protein
MAATVLVPLYYVNAYIEGVDPYIRKWKKKYV